MPRSRSMRMLEGGNDEDGIDAFEAAANRSPNAHELAIDDLPHNEQLAFLGQIPKWPIKSHIIAAIIGIVLIGICLALSIPVLVIYTNTRKCTTVNAQLAKFLPVTLEYGVGVHNLTTQLKSVIETVKIASDIMDTIYLQQVWENNADVEAQLQTSGICGGNVLSYFMLNFGPWDRMNDNEIFVETAEEVIIPNPKPPGANFYPIGMTVDEFETWVNGMTAEQAAIATSPYQLIRRGTDNKLAVRAYNAEYADQLKNASSYLAQAADMLADYDTEVQLKHYLSRRAQDLLDNDYTQSDAAYLQVDDISSTMDIVVGPYEPREDGLLGLKYAFQSYLGVTDPDWSSRALQFAPFLQELQNNLPLNGSAKVTIGPVSLRVVDQIYSGGIAKETISSRAFGHPMDPVLFQKSGGKRVYLKNIQKAKYDKIMTPLSAEITYRFQLPFLSFDGYFFFVLQKELMHGLGPQTGPNAQGEQTNLQTLMGEYYYPLEEAKADIGALWMTNYMIKNNRLNYNMNLTAAQVDLQNTQKMTIQEITRRSIFVSFLLGQFRKVRYGLNTYQSKSAILVLSFLVDRGGITVETSQVDEHDVTRYSVNFSIIDPIIESLLSTILAIQTKVDNVASAALLNQFSYQNLPPQIIATLTAVANVPTDIKPMYAPLP
jgi:hypothetical protein